MYIPCLLYIYETVVHIRNCPMPVRILKHGGTGLLRGVPLIRPDTTYSNSYSINKGEVLVIIEFLNKHVGPGTCVFVTCRLVHILDILRQMFPCVNFCVVSFGIADEDYDPVHSMMSYRCSVDVCEALVQNYKRLYARVLFICMGYDMSLQKKLYDTIKPHRSLLNFDVFYNATDIMYMPGDLVLPIATGVCEGVLYLDCAFHTVCVAYNRQLLHEELCAFYVFDKGFINKDQYDNEVTDCILRGLHLPNCAGLRVLF